MSNGDNKPSTVAWIALVIAILAFVFAWAAFNRAGDDLGETIQQETEEFIETEENGPEVFDNNGAEVEENNTNGAQINYHAEPEVLEI